MSSYLRSILKGGGGGDDSDSDDERVATSFPPFIPEHSVPKSALVAPEPIPEQQPGFGQAQMMQQQSMRARKCYECGQEGHMSKECPVKKSGGIFKETDWICSMCSNRNWEWRDKCNICQTQKPNTQAEKRTGRGGGYNERHDGDAPVHRKKPSLNAKTGGSGAVPSVYITGLKPTVRVEDIAAVFGSIGIIKMDKKTGNPRIKIYRDDAGNPKGDALVTYEDAHTAPSAIEWFDGKPFQGQEIKVQLAEKKSEPAPPPMGMGGPSDFSMMGGPGGRGGRGGMRGGRGGGRGGGGRGGMRGGGAGMPGGDAGDWACQMCGNVNWARRSECNRCGTKKPKKSHQYAGMEPADPTAAGHGAHAADASNGSGAFPEEGNGGYGEEIDDAVGGDLDLQYPDRKDKGGRGRSRDNDRDRDRDRERDRRRSRSRSRGRRSRSSRDSGRHSRRSRSRSRDRSRRRRSRSRDRDRRRR